MLAHIPLWLFVSCACVVRPQMPHHEGNSRRMCICLCVYVNVNMRLRLVFSAKLFTSAQQHLKTAVAVVARVCLCVRAARMFCECACPVELTIRTTQCSGCMRWWCVDVRVCSHAKCRTSATRIDDCATTRTDTAPCLIQQLTRPHHTTQHTQHTTFVSSAP